MISYLDCTMRMRWAYPLAIATLFWLLSCHNNTERESDNDFFVSKDTIDAFLKTKMEQLKIPGLSIAIINDGEVWYHRTMGYANLEKKIPVTEKTIFEGASMSKSVFACFVMTYVEEGKLDLDKPLYEYLPYPDIAHDERYKKITARMVLSHRSGFPNWRENEPDKTLKIKFEPGTGYEYSGEGYQYLAMVLRSIEGTDWNGLEEIFQKKIAKPLGMEHTVFIQTPYTIAHKAEPYDESGKAIDWKNDYWYLKGSKEFGAAYSIHSEPIDFSKWMVAVMQDRLLSKESYNELFKHHSEIPNADIKAFYTLGFNTVDKPYENIFFHSGNNDGFSCWYLLDKEDDWGFVFFTNSEFGGKLGNDLIDFFLDQK
jgi:CubicO group peptidase (beta-lactamase class C family)